MRSDISLEDVLTDKVTEEDLLEVPLSDRIFRGFFIIAFLISLFVFARFTAIGAFKHDFYTRRAYLNMSDVRIDPAPRGIITDRFDRPLLKNESAFNLFLSPSKLPKEGTVREEIIRKTANILGIPEEEILNKLSKRNWVSGPRVLIAQNISHEILVSFSSEEIPGIEIESTFKRVHESVPAFSHLLGYTGLATEEDIEKNSEFLLDDEVGRAGLEAYYDKYIRGKNGEEVYMKTPSGKTEEKISFVLPREGAHMETFIDKEFQEFFYKRFSEALRALGRDSGVGIAMNPQNGEVLALFSVPGYDPTNLGKYLTLPHQPFFNRAVSGLYNPASTIKPLHALAALSEGTVDPTKQIFSQGFIEIPNPFNPDSRSRFMDWKAHGWVDVRSALARSSNVYFYEIGGGFGDQVGLGIQKLKSWWKKFGLGEPTGIDLPGEKFGFLPDPEWKEKATDIPWRLGDTYNVSIGQGDLSITALELLNYINGIGVGGDFFVPRVMKSITEEGGVVVQTSEPKVLRILEDVGEENLKEVQEGMRDAVIKSYGTANLMASLPIEIAGKTGSAQVENNAKTNAFFVGYAPYEDPQISILVLIENAREGSLNVVPVARDIFLWYYENRIKNT